ncbi:MAG: alpha/beta hydrolase [Pseudomonadota bacterium]
MASRAREHEILRLPDGQSVGVARYGLPGGHPVLAFHGAPASRLMFDVADADAKSLGIELICPDRPGYGLSSPDVGTSLMLRTESHATLVDALGLERFHILGVSGGAPYAVALAAKMPDRIRGLGLVSPMGPIAEFVQSGGQSVHPFHRWFFLRFPKQSRLLAANSAVSARFFKAAPQFFSKLFAGRLGDADKAVLRQADVRASVIRMTHESLQQGIWGANADLKIFSEPWDIDFGKVTCPAVLWQGTADRIVSPVVSLALGDQLPNCQTVRLFGQGHFWVYDHITEVLSRTISLKAAV